MRSEPSWSNGNIRRSPVTESVERYNSSRPTQCKSMLVDAKQPGLKKNRSNRDLIFIHIYIYINLLERPE